MKRFTKSLFFDREARSGRDDRLSALVAAAREGVREESLSDDSRARIAAGVLGRHGSTEPLPALFTPARSLVLAATLPLLLAGGLLSVMHRGLDTATPLPTTSVMAVKQGDQVVFRIANGKRSHTVYRSTSPDRFDAASGVRVDDGSYTDTVEDESSLIFYRID